MASVGRDERIDIARGTARRSEPRTAALGISLALAVVAMVTLTGVAFHELSYAGAHPYAYGPAKVIALAAAGAALLSLSVAVLAGALLGERR
jgi:hypothetical protein